MNQRKRQKINQGIALLVNKIIFFVMRFFTDGLSLLTILPNRWCNLFSFREFVEFTLILLCGLVKKKNTSPCFTDLVLVILIKTLLDTFVKKNKIGTNYALNKT